MRRYIIILALLTIHIINIAAQGLLLDEGLSWQLAQHRKATVSNITYNLKFHIPEQKEEAIEGQMTVQFDLNKKTDLILDFNEDACKIHDIRCLNAKATNHDGDRCEWQFVNGHIVIDKRFLRKGTNHLQIDFEAGNQGLNRRDGYVYTLFVPDRAHTVFPCFDQPNLKARFSLELDTPEGWKVASNGTDKPIPTYLFAFAAGDFSYQPYEEDGVKIGAYYRETDSVRIAQLPEIMHQVVFSMKWQEEFTGVKYPFEKYDLVILPGFQFGGMEHVGATFYNDNTIFLPANPTPDECLRRTELIAHETSHMWFGDAVTMNWFDDVWTKEVFANYFAAEITTPLFPTINHELNWLKTYTAAAISQDRTEGRTSIRQPLDNMRYAGLIYNKIIYNKAPVMMRKMVEMMGKDAFQRGIRKYVKTYLYDNATWDDLINILDAETDVDLKSFSKDWVDTAHWPHYVATDYNDARIGREYGYFELTHAQCDELLYNWNNEQDGTRRQALLMTLYENYLNGKVGDTQLMSALTDMLSVEHDPLTAMTLVNYMHEPIRGTFAHDEHFDVELLKMASTHPLTAVRTQLLRLLISKAQTPQVVDSLFQVWERNDNPLLSEYDYTNLSYELAIRIPNDAERILSVQRGRLHNPDRVAQFDYVSRAVLPSEASRDSLFESLKLAENRRIEPWTLSVLYYLNHPLREEQSIKYIRPSLELLPEIQRTGDIFFPANWCSNLLAGHRSAAAHNEVEKYLSAHPELLPLLRAKILEAEYYLKRLHK